MGKLSELFAHCPIIEISEVCGSKPIPGKNGKPDWVKQWQEGFFLRNHSSGRSMAFPVNVDLPRGSVPFAPGFYLFDGSNFEPNGFNEPDLKRFDRVYYQIPADVMSLIEQDAKRG